MKKLSILLIGLLLITGFAVAQEPEISGDATFTIGIDLDGQTFGMLNEASSALSLEWLSGDAESGTEGWITLTGWEVSFASDDAVTVAAPAVEAGWMFDALTIKIYSGPEFEGDNAAGFAYLGLDEDDARNDVEVALSTNNEGAAAATGLPAAAGDDPTDGKVVAVITGDPAPDGAVLVGTDGTYDFYFVPDGYAASATGSFQGLTISYDLMGPVVSLVVASDGDWTHNLDNAFAFGGTVSVPVDPITVDAGVWLGPTDALDVGFTVGASGTIDPISFGIGFDGWMPNGGTLTYDASLDLGVDISGITVDSLTYFRQDFSDIDQEVVLGLSGLVDGFTLTETFQTVDIMSAPFAAWYSLTSLGYDMMNGIAVGLDFGIDNATVIDITATLTATGFVENTVFEVEWAAEDVANSLGALTAAATISY